MLICIPERASTLLGIKDGDAPRWWISPGESAKQTLITMFFKVYLLVAVASAFMASAAPAPKPVFGLDYPFYPQDHQLPLDFTYAYDPTYGLGYAPSYPYEFALSNRLLPYWNYDLWWNLIIYYCNLFLFREKCVESFSKIVFKKN